MKPVFASCDLPPLELKSHTFDWSQPFVMGVVNVTPDSFSDGGKHFDTEAAVAHAEALARAGAHIIDIGGESTRPGSEPVSLAEELLRVVPVIQRLVERGNAKVPISIDTYKSGVAKAAVTAGAQIINDVSGATLDPKIVQVAADTRAPIVLGHIRGTPKDMQRKVHYDDCAEEVLAELAQSVTRAEEAGVERRRILIDPGVGFGKTYKNNLELLLAAGRFRNELQLPVLMGASRKAFIGHYTGAPPGERMLGSVVAAAFTVFRGADVVRVHDVAETVQALKLVQSLMEAVQ